jgi:hypothetical protein
MKHCKKHHLLGRWFSAASLGAATLGVGAFSGCQTDPGIPYDRPFPLGQVYDRHWETQETNAQASFFVIYDHEFIGDSTKLNPDGLKHLVQIALRLPHVPFPVVVEQIPNNKNPQLDKDRRESVLAHLHDLGVHNVECRVVTAPAIADGIFSNEAQQIYGGSGRSGSDYGDTGRGGFGGNAGIRR